MPRIVVQTRSSRNHPRANRALRQIERRKYQYDLRTYGHAVLMRDVLEQQYQANHMHAVQHIFGRMLGVTPPDEEK